MHVTNASCLSSPTVGCGGLTRAPRHRVPAPWRTVGSSGAGARKPPGMTNHYRRTGLSPPSCSDPQTALLPMSDSAQNPHCTRIVLP